MAEETSVQELPTLTAKQSAFVKHLLEGKTASDAYRLAYDCSNMADGSIWREASLLRKHPDVAQWLDTAKRQALVERSYGLQEHLADLQEAVKLCKDNKNYGAMVKATELLGRASGVYVERIQTEASEADIAKILLEMGQPGRELAKDLGVILPDESNNITQQLTKH